jgi:hypothetical protein
LCEHQFSCVHGRGSEAKSRQLRPFPHSSR